jgi:hypothetical protein
MIGLALKKPASRTVDAFVHSVIVSERSLFAANLHTADDVHEEQRNVPRMIS